MRLPDAEGVRIVGMTIPGDGHSAETILATLEWETNGADHQQDVVLRVRPPSPCLIEPYDLGRQFEILRALEGTDVLSPRALWMEPTADVLGREFYAMNRLPGEVFEFAPPADADGATVARMLESMVEQLAMLHTVDVDSTGLAKLADGRDHLAYETRHWHDQMSRVRRGRFPALERLAQMLRFHQPEPHETISVVHGDAKPGNIAFVGDSVSAVFDWEMATIGDPLTDIGWMETSWPTWVAAAEGLTMDDLIARYEDLTGIRVRHRAWYRALARFKLAVILLVGGSLFEAGHSDDLLLADAAHIIHPFTIQGLHELGIDDEIDSGPVLPDSERVESVRASRGGSKHGRFQ
jgi:aminoglycoside phosphotransferase (APT) family kinase protein